MVAARTMAPKAISRRVTMMTPQRSIWILRDRLHAAIQLARTDDHVQVSNQPREGASDMAGKWCVDAPNSVAGDRFRHLRLLIRPQTRRKNISNPTKHQDRGTGATPASTDAGWHWHTAPYYGVVIQGKATHTVKGAAPQTGGPGSVWSQPAGQVHDDKCEEGCDCIEFAYFDGKLDFKPVDSSYRFP